VPHYTGDGPAYSTATVFAQSTQARATIYSDVGLTTVTRNPFPVVAGAYDFYTAEDCYIAFGVDRPIYENSDEEKMSVDEYSAPQAFP
jgi:hypothetical protein